MLYLKRKGLDKPDDAGSTRRTWSRMTKFCAFVRTFWKKNGNF